MGDPRSRECKGLDEESVGLEVFKSWSWGYAINDEVEDLGDPRSVTHAIKVDRSSL